MKNTTILSMIVIIVLVVGGFVFANGKNGTTANAVSNNGNNGQVIQGQMQRVILTQERFNYKDATTKAGMPIAISADSSVKGCLRAPAFNIEGRRYSKYLQSSQDTLQLPALSKGTYSFSCSMGMGFGRLIVQ